MFCCKMLRFLGKFVLIIDRLENNNLEYVKKNLVIYLYKLKK